MSYQFKAACPRCGTTGAGFTAITSSQPLPDRSVDVFALCGLCFRGIIATYTDLKYFSVGDLASLHACRLVAISPSPPSQEAPEFTPDNIASFYRQAMSSLFMKNFDAAGSMFRKTLDAGLKKSFPSITGKLATRIKQAADQHLLTPDLADLANHVRLEGNKAVHEEKPFSAEEAEDLQAFAELVLSYLYFLPGKLEEARDKIDARSEKMHAQDSVN